MVLVPCDGRQDYSVSDAIPRAQGRPEIKRRRQGAHRKRRGAVVKLPDGSLIEMRERLFSVTDRCAERHSSGESRNIIVQAAKQTRLRHLYVSLTTVVSVIGRSSR